MSKLLLFPLNSILLPGSLLPLQVFEERYVHLVQDTIGRRPIGLIQPLTEESEVNPPLSIMGCSARIIRFEEMENGRFFIILRGEQRFHYIADTLSPRGYREAEIRWVIEPPEPDGEERIIADRIAFLDSLTEYLSEQGVKADLSEIEDAPDGQLIDTLAMLLPSKMAERQALLEAHTLTERLRVLETILNIKDTPKAAPKWQH